MSWLRWIVVALGIVEAGFMAFDGGRALVVGDYVTPKRGEHAGQLGPWSRLAERVGIPPRSTAMKLIFLVFGLAWLVVTVAFALEASWAWVLMLVFAVAALWYLVVGTVASLVMIVLLVLPPVRDTHLG